jgi:hypothetical protein
MLNDKIKIKKVNFFYYMIKNTKINSHQPSTQGYN